jgi:hypothetical protein
MESVFVLQHSHTLPGGVEDVKIIGVYRTLIAAKEAVERLRDQPGFSKHPNIIDPDVTDEEDGFYIDKYDLDVDHWREGFVTMIGNREYEDL